MLSVTFAGLGYGGVLCLLFPWLLTTPDAEIGTSPREVIWTHRQTTLYRYRSDRRTHPIPLLLVFALINRPEIFDLRRAVTDFPWNPRRRATLAEVRQIGDVVLLRYALSSRFQTD